MIPFIFLVSITVFVLIKLPPGDFASNYAAALSASGETVDDTMVAELRHRYGLDQSLPVQYMALDQQRRTGGFRLFLQSGSSRCQSH